MIRFDKPVTPAVLDQIQRMQLGTIVAQDELTTLYKANTMRPIHRREMGDLARAANQVVSLDIPSAGTTIVVGGVPYTLTETGWQPSVAQ